MNCTVAISADTKEELVDAAVQHAVAVHGHHELAAQLRQELAKSDRGKPSRATLTMQASFVSGAQRSMSAARRSASSSRSGPLRFALATGSGGQRAHQVRYVQPRAVTDESAASTRSRSIRSTGWRIRRSKPKDWHRQTRSAPS